VYNKVGPQAFTLTDPKVDLSWQFNLQRVWENLMQSSKGSDYSGLLYSFWNIVSLFVVLLIQEFICGTWIISIFPRLFSFFPSPVVPIKFEVLDTSWLEQSV